MRVEGGAAKFSATASDTGVRRWLVMTAFRALSPLWRRVCLTLAVLALVVKVAVPAGYMVDTTTGGAPAIVLCTAQGAVTITPETHHGAPESPAKGHDMPCAFAGHGAAFVAAEPLTVALIEHAAYAPLAPVPTVEAVPGRGLSAPPLPARGPPQVA
jgi:hypothetical protein